MGALAVERGYREPLRYEKLNGKPVLMASPRVNHNTVAGNIYSIFKQYLKGKKCRVFFDGVDVFLTDNDTVIPDVMIVCNPNIIKNEGIEGTPDLIVEILSPNTAQRDRGYKKDLYERCGVKEYWIVEVDWQGGGFVEVYELVEGKYRLQGAHFAKSEQKIMALKPNEIEALTERFSSVLFPEMVLEMKEVFEDVN